MKCDLPMMNTVCTVHVKKTFPKAFTVQPLNVVPTVKRNSGNGKRRLTVRPLTVPFSARVCHAHFSLATRVRYPEVAKLVLTLHEPWQRPTAPKALKNPVDFYAIIRSRRGSYVVSRFIRMTSRRSVTSKKCNCAIGLSSVLDWRVSPETVMCRCPEACRAREEARHSTATCHHE